MSDLSHKLRHRIDIDSLVETRDAYGGVVMTWTPFAEKEPAEIMPMSGKEFVAAQAIIAGVDTRMTIRYRAGVEPEMRVRHDSTTYNILAVLPDPTLRQHLTLMCQSGVVNG